MNSSITFGQKQIMECILGRKAPTEKEIKRIHVMAHTRYGKSIAIAAATCVRAATKKEPWAIVAGNTDQSQIIMDYVIQFSVNDPMIRSLLLNEKELHIERLTQRRKRDHLTYKLGGEVRAYGAGRDGDAVMGQGCPNVIEDESALINNNSQSKIFRMLGDHMDNFYMKVGNPFNNNHFKDAYNDPNYFHINIDYRQGIKDGRLDERFIAEAKQKPNFSVLYENIFPDVEGADDRGWTILFPDSLIQRAFVSEMEPWGILIDGCDPADEGQCDAVIVRRNQNVAECIFSSDKCNEIQFATEIALRNPRTSISHIDSVGVGSGTFNTLNVQTGIKNRISAVNGGGKIPNTVPDKDREQFYNLRAYIFWQLKLWLESGGKILIPKDGNIEKWKQLSHIRYKVTETGKIQIISKKELRSYYSVQDLGWADALSYTFVPAKPRIRHRGVVGGAKPINSSVGY